MDRQVGDNVSLGCIDWLELVLVDVDRARLVLIGR